MKAFGDAVYFITLLSTRDRWHALAIAINRQLPGLLVTTEWVLTEVGDAFSQRVSNSFGFWISWGNNQTWRSFHLPAIYSDAARTSFPRGQIKNGR